jgi:glycosyltransferase involved in cell wall biosynthesis
VLHEGGVPRDRIFPVLNGIDPGAFALGRDDGRSIRRELGMERPDPLIVMVAQLVEWKRQHVLIEAFRAVVDAHPAARLLLVGTDPYAPLTAGKSYIDRCRSLVRRLGLDDRVVFAGRRGDVPQILAEADIACLPSVDDPCALVHIEAMAVGTPVVGVRAGGAPELIQDGRTGLLVAPDDVPGLARNLSALIDDPGRRRAMGDAGRRRVVEHLNARRMADEVEAVYRLVCGVESAPTADALL